VAKRLGGEPSIADGFLKQCPERVPKLVRVKRRNAEHAGESVADVPRGAV
jgi:hypothetical protein